MLDFNLEFARGGASFTTDIINRLANGDFKQNLIVSPFSIQACIALAFAGAEGDTAEEIAQVLRFASNFPPEVADTFRFVFDKYRDSEFVKIANKLYVKEGSELKQEYQAATKEHYHAEVESINFSESEDATQTINNWVSEMTAGKITELISTDSVDGNTRVLLLNALHFKGEWAQKFNEDQTVEDEFWISEEESIQLSYMNQKAKFGYSYFEDLNCTALEMPYQNSDLSLLAFLPQERGGLQELVEKLKEVNLVDLNDRFNEEEVEVKFPKFQVNYFVDLTDQLKELGINKMFTGDAEFGNMLESPEDIFVSKVVHKSSIEINEEGSEAAAATGAIMMTRMTIPLLFHADRPFLYLIWNKRNILFAGTFVTAPTA